MTDHWTWTPQEWERIVRIARQHRSSRTWVSVLTVGTVQRRAFLAEVRGTALELRQWAARAGDRRIKPDDPRLAPGAAAAVRRSRP